jgi:O-antigen/teichoic acid export membrane protein
MRRKVPFDLALTVAGQLAFKLLGFAILALLARGLGVAEFGFLTFALATCELLALATDFGSGAYLTREVAVARPRALHLLGEVLGPRLVLLAGYLASMAAVGVALAPAGGWAVFMACALYAGLKQLHLAFAAVFTGTRRVAIGVAAFGSHLCVLATGVWAATSLGLGVGAAAGVYLLAGLWLTLISVALLSRHFGMVRPSLPAWRRVVASSLPLFGLGLLTTIQLRLDSALLGLLRPYADVAVYEASARLFEASQAIVRPLTTVFLPICAGLAAAGAYDGLRRSLARLSAVALAVGAAAFLAANLLADQVVPIVYGAGYEASAGVLRVHFAATPFVFLGAVALFHLTAIRRERTALLCAAAGLGINAVLDLRLIPGHGPVGAAWATLAAEATTATGLLATAWLALAAAAGKGQAPAAALAPENR